LLIPVRRQVRLSVRGRGSTYGGCEPFGSHPGHCPESDGRTRQDSEGIATETYRSVPGGTAPPPSAGGAYGCLRLSRLAAARPSFRVGCGSDATVADDRGRLPSRAIARGPAPDRGGGPAVTGAPREMVAALWEAARKIGPMRSLQGRCTRRCASYTARVARLHSEQPLSHTRDRCVPSIQKSRRFAWWCIEPGASDRAGGKHRGFARMGPIVTALPPYRSRIAPGAPDPDCAP